MKNLRYLLFVVFLQSCAKFEPLKYQRENYFGQNLKLNGYYYIFKTTHENKTLEDLKYNAFFLFRNGIFFDSNFLSPLPYEIKRLDSLDINVRKNIVNKNKYVDLQYQWGLFNINNSEITIERWVTASGGGAYPTQMLKGIIKNDTTINFHTLVGAYPINVGLKKKTMKINEIYHFRQFSPKPDSTNNYIK